MPFEIAAKGIANLATEALDMHVTAVLSKEYSQTVGGTGVGGYLSTALANAKGELSDVRHAECGTGSCTVRLVLERGKNTISIGAIDGLSQTTAYTMLSLNATRSIAGTPGKTEWF